MDIEEIEETTTLFGIKTVSPISNTIVTNHLEEELKVIKNNRSKVEELISKLGKFDERFISKKPSTAHDCDEFLYYLVKPEVLVEKIGNQNKGVFIGLHADYGFDIKSQRDKYKEDNNIFKMWVKGEIRGSVVVTSEAGLTSNVLTNETFFGCNYDYDH